MTDLQPYPGLRPFESDEADIFFGREEQTDELLSRLNQTRFLAVVGASGCGKSSLVRAGMIPALETGFMAAAGSRWQFVQIRPGSHPIRRLAEALAKQADLLAEDEDKTTALGFLNATLRRGPLGLVEALTYSPLPEHTNLLVLVDQFEEVFRFRREGDRDEADAFVAMLIQSSQQRDIPIYIAITMRSDFIGDCALFNGLPEILNQCQYLTPRLTREQQQMAIVGPARVFGGDVEPELVNSLLNEMGTDPDQLPLLQHLLMRIWTCAQLEEASEGTGCLLTMRACEAVGGLKHALSNHLDEAYGNLSDRQKCIAEMLFRRLSERGTDQRDIRRPTIASEIVALAGVSLEELVGIVDIFRAPTRSFLVPCYPETIYPNTMLDITHESLIRQWDRLRGWAEAEAQSAETYRLLEQAARRWKEGFSGLWSTPDLETAVAWKARERPSVAWAKRYGGNFGLAMQFLEVSEQESKAEENRAEARRLKEIHRLKRSRAAWVIGCITLAVTVFVIWDIQYREHVKYYNAFIKRWGIPEGMGELNSDQVRHRALSFKFTSIGEKVISVKAVDSRDECTPKNNVGTSLNFNPEPSPFHECYWEFLRDPEGNIIYEKAYSKYNKLVWGFAYTPPEKEKKKRSAYFIGPDGFPEPRKNAAAEIVEIEYSDTGEEIIWRFWNRRHKRQPGPDMAYGHRLEYYDNGLIRRMSSLDADDHLMNDNAGNAITEYEYDNFGNTKRGRGFDKDRNPILFKNGWHDTHLEYDQNGNIITQAFFDTAGQPARYNQRCHKATFQYDQAGNVIGMACFDGRLQPTQDENGCQLTTFTYDKKGNQTETACFDYANQKPANFDAGHHNSKVRYDNQGNAVEWRYFDTEGHPTFVKDGNYMVSQTYDESGHVLNQAFFTAQGKPMYVVGGYHKIESKYDVRGNETSRAYFDVDNAPTLQDNGYHKAIMVPDERGNVTEQHFFDSDGNRVLNNDGYSLEKFGYNDRSQMTERAFYDTHHDPVLANEGYHREKLDRDERGNVTERRFLDTNGKPVLHKNGYYRQVSSFDERDQEVEKAFFGANDAPVLLKDGYHRQTWAYDDRGNVIETVHFGLGGEPVDITSGYHKAISHYDEAGNLIEQAYFSPEGHPTQNKEGYSVIRKHYEDSGRTVEERYLDVEGKPINPEDGCFIWRGRTDAKGRYIEGACFDKEHQPIRSNGGFAKFIKAYDNLGNETETKFLGEDGKLVVGKEGYAILRQAYDEHSRIIEQSYYGANDAPILLKDEYHRQTLAYDDQGNVIETAHFGLGGESVDITSGYHKAISHYDDAGNLIEQAYFSPEGHPTQNKEGYSVIRKHYEDSGRTVEERYLDVEGKPTKTGNGCFIVRGRTDAKGRLIEAACFDKEHQPMRSNAGFAEVIKAYDNLGNETETKFLGEDGKLVVGKEGYAILRQIYDEHSRIIEQSYYGEDSNAKSKILYHADGRIENLLLGPDGKPIFNPLAGYAIKKMDRRQTGDTITSYHGPDGELIMGPEGFAEVRIHWGEDGDPLSEAWFGPDSVPIVGPTGCHRIERIPASESALPKCFDDQNREVQREPVVSVIFIAEITDIQQPAAKAGLQAGDVLWKYGNWTFVEAPRAAERSKGTEPGAILEAVAKEFLAERDRASAQSVSMTVIRNGNPIMVTIPALHGKNLGTRLQDLTVPISRFEKWKAAITKSESM
jgi:YD repeat-containing protein